MAKEKPERKAEQKGPFQVFGLFVLVKVLKEPVNGIEVSCPKGANILYGEVATAGDGFDADAEDFRPMPARGSIVTFEESAEQVEGHYFYLSGDEYRVVHVDSLIVSFPPKE